MQTDIAVRGRANMRGLMKVLTYDIHSILPPYPLNTEGTRSLDIAAKINASTNCT